MSTFFQGFDGYWRRPNRDYKTAVRTYLIVLDANVLLELYRFTPKAREELLDVLGKLGSRLWIPHQVVAEYYARRVDAVKEHLELYTDLPESLDEHKVKVLAELNRFAKRCSLDGGGRSQLVDPIAEAFTTVKEKIDQLGKAFDLSLEKMVEGDHVLISLSKILDGKTGGPFNETEEGELLAQYARRATAKTPPGYKDAGKPENAHGDFFVWEQLLRHAGSIDSPVLFVTNDAKEDWVRRQSGFIVGARPELIAEFTERCGQDFLLTQLGNFLRTAKEELKVDVSPSTVAQAENLQSQSGARRRMVISKTHRDRAVHVLGEVKENDTLTEEDREMFGRLLAELQRAQPLGVDGNRLGVSTSNPAVMERFLEITDPRGKYSALDNRDARNLDSEASGKLGSVIRRQERAVADYERAVAALAELPDGQDFGVTREVLEVSRDEAEHRMRSLAVRRRHLERDAHIELGDKV